MMPVAIGFDLVPGTVRKGLFLASLLNGVNAAKGQREEGTNYEKMNEYVMSFVTVAFVIAVILMYVTQLKPTTREVGVQVSLDKELAISMNMLTVAELKKPCLRESVPWIWSYACGSGFVENHVKNTVSDDIFYIHIVDGV